MLKNLFYHKKTGVVITIIFLIVIPILNVVDDYTPGDADSAFLASLFFYIALYVIPINIIVHFQKISKTKKLKQKEHEEKLTQKEHELKLIQKKHEEKLKLKQKEHEEKLKFYENNLGHKLLDEFNECKTDADYKLWEERNSNYFYIVRAFVIQEIEKKHNNLLIRINKIDREIEVLEASFAEEKSLTQDLLKRHPFLKKLIKHKNFL